MRVTDEMVNAARSAYSVDRIPNGEIINKIAGPGYGDKLIRGIIESALSHAAGQDGEQCRAASGVEEIARQMDAMAGHIQASSPEQKSERLRGWASMLRALSRVVPEGNAVIPWRDEIDRMYVEGWAQSLRRIKDYRAYFIEHGYHPEYVAVRLERLLAAIAAQRKEGE